MKFWLGLIIFLVLTNCNLGDSSNSKPISITHLLECYKPNQYISFQEYINSHSKFTHFKISSSQIPAQWKQSIYFCKAEMGDQFYKSTESILSISNLHQDQLEIQIQSFDGNLERFLWGDKLSETIENSDSKTIQLSDIKNIYIRFESQDGFQDWNEILFWKKDQYEKNKKLHLILTFTFLGILIGVFAFSILSTIVIHSKKIGSFSLWVLSSLNLFLYLEGFYYKFQVFPSRFSNSILLLSLSLCLYFFFVFSGHYFKNKPISPNSKKFLSIYSIMILCVNINFGSFSVPLMVLVVFMVGASIYIFSEIIKSIQKEQNQSYFIFLSSSASIYLPLLIKGFDVFGIFEHLFDTSVLVYSGFSFAFLLLISDLTSKANREMIFNKVIKDEKILSETLRNQIKETKISISRSEKSKLINQLASQLVLEINNPLNFISTGDTIIFDQLNRLKVELEDVLDDTRDSKTFALELETILNNLTESLELTNRGMGIIRDTIKEIRDISGVNGVLVDNFDIHNLLHKSLMELNEKKNLSKSHIKIFVNGTPWKADTSIPPLVVFSNQYIISRSFRTILSNAVHFAEKNPLGMIDIRTTVIDSGLNKIFTIYFKNNGPPVETGKEVEILDVKRMRLHGGDFIGLPMIRELLKSMNGSLTLVDHGRESGWVNIQVHLMNFESKKLEAI
jgi:hypothetical protein